MFSLHMKYNWSLTLFFHLQEELKLMIEKLLFNLGCSFNSST